MGSNQMAVVYLVTELCALTAASFSFVFNLYIITCFVRKKIPSPENLRLALYLAIGDFGYATAALIHIGYLAINWSNVYLDYNPYMIIFSNSFLPAHLKVVVVISCSMALDRCLAIFFPVVYRQLSKTQFANVAALIGYAWFLFDYLFQMTTAPYMRMPNCATMACFVNKKFLMYVSYSNTPVVKQTNVFRQANRITVGILFCSLFFVTIPSLLVTGYEEVTGISLFTELGPFYICAILVNGFADGLVFVIVNRKQIGSKNRTLSSTVSTVPTRIRTSVVGTSSRVAMV
uniref:G-protein coupled receptors family 1 profile domain-containing protein n=2 Tax=Caenorhabditis japonica TaxID=281687 RepID=A0A8R1I9G8_CAEJA